MDLARIKTQPVNIPIKAVRIVCIDPIFLLLHGRTVHCRYAVLLIYVYMYDPSKLFIHIMLIIGIII